MSVRIRNAHESSHNGTTGSNSQLVDYAASWKHCSEARAIPNLIGNTVATVAAARWDGALDVDRAGRVLDAGARI